MCVAACSLSLLAQEAALETIRVNSSEATGVVHALSAPYKTVSFSYVQPVPATAPFFSHGYVIQYIRHTTFAGASNIYVYNSFGNLAHEVAIWPTGAAKLFVTCVDVGANGQLAYAGVTTKGDGSTFAFIATSELDGANPK